MSSLSAAHAAKRIRVWYAILVLVIGVFGVRLFYVQIIRYDHYKKAALSDQLKQYEIPASRGVIEAQDDGNNVPIVLNQKLYILYADPTFVKDPNKAAGQLVEAVGGNAKSYTGLMKTPGTRYVVLAKKLSDDEAKKVTGLQIPGVGVQGQDYRIYPQGSLAAQLLGFVNADGQGEYGIEQALSSELAGTPGQLKAITDVNGVPLAASNNNVLIQPKAGKNVVLTIDLGMQQQMEKILKDEYKKTRSQGISALIMDPHSGQVKAMANYPTYNPADYQDAANASVFQNGAVTDAVEPGSTMKTLTASAALDAGAITPSSSFYDPAHWKVDGFNITDIEQDGGARQQNVASTLALSLNTGAVWMLMQMSQPGSTQINDDGVKIWHDYMVKHYRLGQPTGIEQGYEAPGYVPPANLKDPAIELRYANTAFGQGVQMTPIQIGAALSSILNGGTYYQPTLVSQTVDPASGKADTHQPKVLEKHVVSPKVGQEMVPLMENVVNSYYHEGFSFMNFPSSYLVGGKTGTAQVAQPGGGYYANVFNGTYVGFVGGNKPQYVIVVFNNKPNVPGYAGSMAGQPVFADLAHMLIDNSYVTPKSR